MIVVFCYSLWDKSELSNTSKFIVQLVIGKLKNELKGVSNAALEIGHTSWQLITVSKRIEK